MIQRLRPLPSPEALAEMYTEPHDHRLYGRGHGERVDATIALAVENIPEADRAMVVDLSCGNGAIAVAISSNPWLSQLGDMAMISAELPAAAKYCGPIEQTLQLVSTADVWVLSETAEHLDDPQGVLYELRRRATWLVLSTPLECWADTNLEHCWAWDREGVELLLEFTGWTPRAFTSVDSREYGEPYLYGIWVCS